MGFSRKTKSIIRIIGVFVLLSSFLITFGINSKTFPIPALYYALSFGLMIAGIAMIFQGRFLKGMKKVGKDLDRGICNCCKCTNCDRNHNHWTHD
jgi:uncharacterized membrane protein YedE/YeeE